MFKLKYRIKTWYWNEHFIRGKVYFTGKITAFHAKKLRLGMFSVMEKKSITYTKINDFSLIHVVLWPCINRIAIGIKRKVIKWSQLI